MKDLNKSEQKAPRAGDRVGDELHEMPHNFEKKKRDIIPQLIKCVSSPDRKVTDPD